MTSKVALITLGCGKNVSDTDNLTRTLKAQGHEVVTDAAEADTIVVHTCSFIEAAKKESIDTILQAGRVKGEKKKLIVSGCLVQQHGQELFKEMPEVDAFLGTGQLAQIPALLDKPRARFLDRSNPGGYMNPDVSTRRSSGAPAQAVSPTAYLRLSEGCSHPCSFCVIPRLRGPVQSRSPETILKNARELADQGVEELVVIAQDTGDWGREWQSREPKAESRKRLPELLRQVGAIPGIRWVRLMYMHPASFTEELLSVFAEQPEKFPYLDMPLQHIDSKVLSEMRRKTDEAGLRKLIERIRFNAPNLTLRTTFIVGHPGETETQFKRLLNFIREGHFDYLGAFTYSKEAGTISAKRRQIPERVKKDRLAALTDAYYGVAHAKAQKRLGTVETVLLEETEGDEVLGRTRREAPEIDAVIRLPRKASRKGRFVQVKLTGYDAYEYSALPHA